MGSKYSWRWALFGVKLEYEYFDDTKKQAFQATCKLCQRELRFYKALTEQEKQCGYTRSGLS